jgi:F1F0 ATPase subunit 2
MGNVLQSLIWLLAGVGLGAIHMYLIGRTVAAVQSNGASRATIIPIMARLLIVTCVLILAARQGAMPLLMVLAGFLVARSITIRRVKRGN